MLTLKNFVVLLYDRTSSETRVDAARKLMYCNKGRAIDAILPTAAALLQPTMRTIYQGGFVWGQLGKCHVELPSQELYG